MSSHPLFLQDGSCHLLTGGTGFLGSYLMRDLLRQGVMLVVLARPSRKESAQGRIESIVAHWEKELGLILAKPVVIEGDLTDSKWRHSWLSWLSQHCRSVIHCGASLVFRGSPSEEPWTTNIGGTSQVLELCRAARIRELHHFSTAYVAGSFQELFCESLFDVKQELRNDYEKSKFESERMVRDASFIDSLTIYRPSIIVGDSQSAYTSSYHGFYAVLKLAHTLVNRLTLGATSGRRLLESLGMNGSEHENFVSVDWVSAVVSHIFLNPQFHGKTFHLTNPNPTPIFEMVDTIQEAIETYSSLASADDTSRASEDWFRRTYADQLQIYEHYLNDDPKFDSLNTRLAAAHLSCPEINHDKMLMFARYAIKNGFGKKPSRNPSCIAVLPTIANPQVSHADLLYAEQGNSLRR